MKKLISLSASVLVATAAFGYGSNGNTGAPTPSVTSITLSPGTSLLLTNNVKVVNVQLLSAYNATVAFYDNSATNSPTYGTNVVLGAYATTASYTTNLVQSYVGSNGYTNWYTNSAVWTYNVTNSAATNALTPTAVYAVSPNIAAS